MAHHNRDSGLCRQEYFRGRRTERSDEQAQQTTQIVAKSVLEVEGLKETSASA